MVVYFYTDWCGYCRRFEEQVLYTPEVDRFLSHVMVRVRVNPETGSQERAIANGYAVNGYPSFFLVAPAPDRRKLSPYRDDGSGLMSPAEFVSFLEGEVRERAQRALYEGHERRKAGDTRGAIALLDQAIALAPENAEAHLQRGVALGEAGELERALGDLRRALELKPGDTGPYEWLDFLLTRQQRWDEIAACWTEVIERDPGSAKAYFGRGGSYYRKGDRARALQDVEKACSLGEPRGCEVVGQQKG